MPTPVTKTAAGAVVDTASTPGIGEQADIGTLRQLWRFRDYGRAELRSLVLGTVMRGCELAAVSGSASPGHCWSTPRW